MKKEVVKSLSFTKLSKKELDNLIEIPKDFKMGDYAFPCFVFAKKKRKNPVEIAKEFVKKIKKDGFEKVVASGGYVNFFIDQEKFANKIINDIIKKRDKYGSMNKKRRIMVEFSQPNTHKAFHIGHVRGTSFGESLARILEFSGNKVVRANYSGDSGMHIAKWVWCYQKFHNNEEMRNDENWIASIYVDAIKRLAKNDKLQEEVDIINKKIEMGNDLKINNLWKETKILSIRSWERIYDELNTKFDVHFFESEVEIEGKKIVKKLVKDKIAEVSDGATIVRMDKFGLGVWVLLRKDGTVLYSAKDLALAEKKFKDFKIDYSIIETGSEQDLHFRQLNKTLDLMKFKYSKKYKHLSHGLIRLPWGKMSSRTGDNVLYSDFRDKMINIASKEIEKRFPKLESVKIEDRALAIFLSALKYSMLKQDLNKNIVFDPKKSISFEGDTGPYLLYSYARALSILDNAEYKSNGKYLINKIEDSERKLLNLLGKFPETVEHAYRDFAPNLIANYSYELAQAFSEFYHNCPVIESEEEGFRLKIVDCFSQVMKNSLNLLGIPVIREM